MRCCRFNPAAQLEVAVIARKRITIDLTSELVDWRKIRAWLDAEYKHVPMWDKDTRRPFCDAQNFHLCLTAIDERNKAAATTT